MVIRNWIVKYPRTMPIHNETIQTTTILRPKNGNPTIVPDHIDLGQATVLNQPLRILSYLPKLSKDQQQDAITGVETSQQATSNQDEICSYSPTHDKLHHVQFY